MHVQWFAIRKADKVSSCLLPSSLGCTQGQAASPKAVEDVHSLQDPAQACRSTSLGRIHQATPPHQGLRLQCRLAVVAA